MEFLNITDNTSNADEKYQNISEIQSDDSNGVKVTKTVIKQFQGKTNPIALSMGFICKLIDAVVQKHETFSTLLNGHKGLLTEYIKIVSVADYIINNSNDTIAYPLFTFNTVFEHIGDIILALFRANDSSSSETVDVEHDFVMSNITADVFTISTAVNIWLMHAYLNADTASLKILNIKENYKLPDDLATISDDTINNTYTLVQQALKNESSQETVESSVNNQPPQTPSEDNQSTQTPSGDNQSTQPTPEDNQATPEDNQLTPDDNQSTPEDSQQPPDDSQQPPEENKDASAVNEEENNEKIEPTQETSTTDETAVSTEDKPTEAEKPDEATTTDEAVNLTTTGEKVKTPTTDEAEKPDEAAKPPTTDEAVIPTTTEEDVKKEEVAKPTTTTTEEENIKDVKKEEVQKPVENEVLQKGGGIRRKKVSKRKHIKRVARRSRKRRV